MSDLFDYITWRGDLSFEQSPFGNVDALIISRLSYLPLDGIVSADFHSSITLKSAADRFLAAPSEVRMEQDIPLIRRMAESRRYGEMLLCGYINQHDDTEQKQFAALCCETHSNMIVSFRGTDGTLVGWKEDFNMAFSAPVPAQRSAAEYLLALIKSSGKPIITVGHSKGGNLAVYSAANVGQKHEKRIAAVYNNDGPGFDRALLSTGGFSRVSEKTKTFVPQSSVIGMLLEHEEAYTVVRSVNSGLMQHDLYSWELSGPELVTLSSVTTSSRVIDETLRDWLASMSYEQREMLTDALFTVLGSTGAETLREMSGSLYKTAGAIFNSARGLDTETVKALQQIVKLLAKSVGRNISEEVRELVTT